MKYEEFKERFGSKAQKRAKPKHHEEQLQTSCVQWFRLAFSQYVCFAVPNGGSRNAIEAARMKQSGTLAGVSDLIVIGNKSILFVEMKTNTGRQSDKQKQFQKDIERLGYQYVICRSLSEFMKSILAWDKANNNMI